MKIRFKLPSCFWFIQYRIESSRVQEIFRGILIFPFCAIKAGSVVTSLAATSFHAVVFCLLLEYLPTPQARWEKIFRNFQPATFIQYVPVYCMETDNLLQGGKKDEKIKM
jgi:hypothetical protein